MSRTAGLLVVPLLCLPAAGQPLAGRPPRELVETLLKTAAQNDGEHRSDFFRSLAELARSQGLKPSDYTSYDSGEGAGSGRAQGLLPDGRAVAITAEGKRYVVVILGTQSVNMGPGRAAQQLVLLGEDGTIRDKLGCVINSRLGSVTTDVLDRPAADGARLVVRFQPRAPQLSTWHNWHTITHNGRPYTFWEQERGDPVDWMKHGLARVAIDKGAFRVVFPELKQPDKKLDP